MPDSEEAEALRAIANAITDTGAMPGRDDAGGHVGCLTEAIMGLTAAVVRVAEEQRDIGEAVVRIAEEHHAIVTALQDLGPRADQ